MFDPLSYSNSLWQAWRSTEALTQLFSSLTIQDSGPDGYNALTDCECLATRH